MLYFDYYGSKPQTHMHTASAYKTIPVCDSRTSPACHASLIHHSVIPRLGLSVSHMT
jgi:hypothetical protein